MSEAIPPFPQYALMAWCLVKAPGQLHLLPLHQDNTERDTEIIRISG